MTHPKQYRKPGRGLRLHLSTAPLGEDVQTLSGRKLRGYVLRPYRVEYGCQALKLTDADVLDIIRFFQELRRLP